MELTRTYWQSVEGGGDCPVDRLLDRAQAALSVGARELCCRQGTDCRSFARAADNLGHSAQLQIGQETVRKVVENEGKAVLRANESEQLEIDWSAAGCKTSTPDGREVSRIYASADGVMVATTTDGEKDKRRRTVLERRRRLPRSHRRRLYPLGTRKKGSDQRYKQFNIVTFYDQDQTHRLVSVTRRDHRGSQRLLRRDAARLRIRGADERIGLIDGAPTLQQQMQSLPLTALGLDFYHLSEHVHEAKRGVYGENSAEGKAWVGDVLHTVKHEGYEPFWEKLCRWRNARRGRRQRRTADKLLHYVAQRREMIRYDEFRGNGCHIGTGPVESMGKSETLRVKGPGMRWDSDDADAMMALEALRQSNLWKPYWKRAVHINQ